MPTTAAFISVMNNIEYTDIFDIKTNIELGCAYFSFLLSTHDNIDEALMAYNCGPTRLKRGNLPEETLSYLPSVMNIYNRM